MFHIFIDNMADIKIIDLNPDNIRRLRCLRYKDVKKTRGVKKED